MAVEILIQKVLLEGGAVRFDLVGKNLPENFLGMAADLKFNAGGVGVKYDKMEWGNAFAGFTPDNLPVKMVKYEKETAQGEGKIIFGISLKADDLKNLHDGVIGSFYFSGTAEALRDLQFSGFQHAVISVYENGRVDLSDVKWLETAQQIKLPADVISPAVTQTVEVVEPLTLSADKSLAALPNPVQIPIVKAVSAQQETKVAVSELPSIVSNDFSSSEPVNLETIPMLSADSGLTEFTHRNEVANNSDNQLFWWYGFALLTVVLLVLIGFLHARRKVVSRSWQYVRA